jgi:PhnB protein
MTVNPIPEGYHSVQPYLIVNGAKGLLEFVTNVFGAAQTELMEAPDGSRVMHAEVKLGDSTIMMSDAQGPWQPMPAAMYVYVPNVDETFRKAVAAGGTSVMEPADQFYGYRHGGVKDPWGNFWWIATRVENVSAEEMQRRAQAFMAQKQHA